jgi:hypothetical protein
VDATGRDDSPFNKAVHWTAMSDAEIAEHTANTAYVLSTIQIMVDAITCTDANCTEAIQSCTSYRRSNLEYFI